MAADSIEKFKLCDLVISPDELGRYGTFQKQGIDEIYDIGYQSAKEQLLNSSFFHG